MSLSAKEFFLSHKDTKIGDHSKEVAGFLFIKFYNRFSKFNYLVRKGGINKTIFVGEWHVYIKELTPRIIEQTWKYIEEDKNREFLGIILTVKDFLTIANRFRKFDTDHTLAKSLNAAVAGCHCDYCKDRKIDKVIERSWSKETVDAVKKNAENMKDKKMKEFCLRLCEKYGSTQ